MLRPWIHALRLRTLPLAISSILTGSALAAFYHGFRWPVFLLALLTAVLLQVLSNLANDLGDHLHGTDDHSRVGPQRAVQSGAISPVAMKRAMWACGLLALVCGLALIIVALGLSATMLVFLLIGLLAIGAAVKYTFGSNPYGYAGFGDISVLLFFGMVGVAGTLFLHTGAFNRAALLPALGIGLLCAAVLNLNNMRDIAGDAANGKRTLAVRMGSSTAKRYHALLIYGGLACLVIFTATHFKGWWQLAFVLGFLPLDRHLRTVQRNTVPRELDPQMKVLALSTLVTALLFSLGLIPG
ncbi:MAG: 1,4-dihydroxy-2-naphthoate polyprenyltransferase [Bacteroidetes bacterium]|nr:1,4-dihydroxy-2-naphthoate polyprenyltransferase [Bacteroidota bacterium]MBS1943119.1 1,4-dihydroxy-2-naphthoate polyprenyltransferase [Bacteroidota bacterium]